MSGQQDKGAYLLVKRLRVEACVRCCTSLACSAYVKCDSMKLLDSSVLSSPTAAAGRCGEQHQPATAAVLNRSALGGVTRPAIQPTSVHRKGKCKHVPP